MTFCVGINEIKFHQLIFHTHLGRRAFRLKSDHFYTSRHIVGILVENRDNDACESAIHVVLVFLGPSSTCDGKTDIQ